MTLGGGRPTAAPIARKMPARRTKATPSRTPSAASALACWMLALVVETICVGGDGGCQRGGGMRIGIDNTLPEQTKKGEWVIKLFMGFSRYILPSRGSCGKLLRYSSFGLRAALVGEIARQPGIPTLRQEFKQRIRRGKNKIFVALQLEITALTR